MSIRVSMRGMLRQKQSPHCWFSRNSAHMFCHMNPSIGKESYTLNFENRVDQDLHGAEISNIAFFFRSLW